MHTFALTLPQSLSAGDGFVIEYPDNFDSKMPLTCSITTHVCNVYPSRNLVSIILTGNLGGSISLALSGMNNPASESSSAASLMKLRAYKGGTAAFHYLPVIPAFDIVGSTSGTALTLAPQQASFFLNDYLNIVKLEATNLYAAAQVRAFYVIPPAEVQSWDSTFCNGSLVLPSASRDPYSLRLACSFLSGKKLLLELPPDTAYQAAYSTYSVEVTAKMLLSGSGATSGEFHMYGSRSATDSSSIFYVSVAKSTIAVSPQQVPLFGIASFNTLPYARRVAQTYSTSTFTLLLQPAPGATVTRVLIRASNGFQYPSTEALDDCKTYGAIVSSFSSCRLTRSNQATLLDLVPASFDSNPKIITASDRTLWFTNPLRPGSFYNLTVSIFDGPTLIEEQAVNISLVAGPFFAAPTL